ncbi:protein of unknown function [Alcaligenes faecalis subsp. faecalis]|nr:protein of unknown function [Alcaligenes faecalis subsp. faecalis]
MSPASLPRSSTGPCIWCIAAGGRVWLRGRHLHQARAKTAPRARRSNRTESQSGRLIAVLLSSVIERYIDILNRFDSHVGGCLTLLVWL